MAVCVTDESSSQNRATKPALHLAVKCVYFSRTSSSLTVTFPSATEVLFSVCFFVSRITEKTVVNYIRQHLERIRITQGRCTNYSSFPITLRGLLVLKSNHIFKVAYNDQIFFSLSLIQSVQKYSLLSIKTHNSQTVILIICAVSKSCVSMHRCASCVCIQRCVSHLRWWRSVSWAPSL